MWDDINTIEVYMPGEDLASPEAVSVLAGRNRLWAQHDAGWELLGFRQADLLGDDRWRLSGLLRGLRSSVIGAIKTGAVIVVADDRLMRASVSPEDIERELVWRVGTSNDQTFTIPSTS